MKDSATVTRHWFPLVLEPYVSTLLRQAWVPFFLILSVNAALLGGLLVLEFGYGVDHWNLVRDTNAVAGQPAYFGSYSNLGILIWAAGAAITLFAWRFLARKGIRDRHSRALGLGGSFMAVACLDDLFMLHENSYVVGLSEVVVLAGYAVLLIAFVTSVLPILHRTQWLLLGAALACLAFSTLFDASEFPGSVLLEEVFKLSGISLLAAYLVALSFSAVAEASGRPRGQVVRGSRLR